jgi:outer membrane protein TolC
LLPKIDGKPNYIYTSPSIGPGRLRLPSFLGANAINEIQGLVIGSGEIDISGKLSATLRRNRALLAAAHAGTEVARRTLIQSVSDAYFNLALATAKRRAAENNLGVAQEFENNTKLQLDAGEVAPVDYTRARLQTSARRDELEQARGEESVGADGLRVFTGTSFGDPIATVDLLTEMPVSGDIERFAEALMATRPEFAQFEAQKKAAEEDIHVARGERMPQITYSAGSGFISESLAPAHLRNSAGVQVNVGVTIPIFDWGAAKARETQAKLKVQLADNARALAERQFAQAFFTARTQSISARTRIAQIAASITDAENNVAASIARYRAGEATILEVTDAQNTFVTQKTALYQAIFDYQVARSHLMRAAGQ